MDVNIAITNQRLKYDVFMSKSNAFHTGDLQ